MTHRRFIHRFSIVLGLLSLLVLSSSRTVEQGLGVGPVSAQHLSDPVPTEYGLVRGEVLENSITFRGVPYTAPPVGDLRWAPPQPHSGWDVFDAVKHGPPCAQLSLNGQEVIGSEDCLTLNIWAPKQEQDVLWPVMFSIHGGGNIIGSSSSPTFDGQDLVEKGGVVVVTINYRLGQFGFLAHPLLSKEDEVRNSSGNYGLLDQLFALQWVRRNIANFGGDPGNVTIFGESAGGLDVACLVASPEATGLFHRAIVQSGGFFVSRPLRDEDDTKESAEEFGQRYEAAIGCASLGDPIACLRRQSMENVARTLPGVLPILGQCEGGNCPTYGPNIDGSVLTDSPIFVILRGRHNNVPMMVGTNKNEGSLFILGIPLSTEAEYRAAVEMFFPTISESVLTMYPVADYGRPRDAFDAIYTDLAFVGPTRMATRTLALWQRDLFVYHFTHRLATPPWNELGAFHALELSFIFNNFDLLTGHTPTEDELLLADAMLGYWTNFARAGNPNGAGLPVWPAYRRLTDRHQNLDVTIRPGANLRREYYNFWCRTLGLFCL